MRIPKRPCICMYRRRCFTSESSSESVYAANMPVSSEQWRAAVGTWNRRLQGKFPSSTIGRHWSCNITNLCEGVISLLFILVRVIAATLDNGYRILGRLVPDVVGCPTPCDYLVIFRWDYTSIVARRLLIISGDIEVNPGPSKSPQL